MHAGVADDAVVGAVRCDIGLDRGTARSAVGDVEAHEATSASGCTNPRRRLLGARLVAAIVHHDLVALPAEHQRDRRSNSLARAGDENGARHACAAPSRKPASSCASG